jgi:hypothetical protein
MSTGAIISGVVRDASGTPVPSARLIFVESPVPLPDISLLTNPAGAFQLNVPVAGRYTIAATAPGYARTTAVIEVRGNGDTHTELTLHDALGGTLPSVTSL